jgi:hypothetical protein
MHLRQGYYHPVDQTREELKKAEAEAEAEHLACSTTTS